MKPTPKIRTLLVGLGRIGSSLELDRFRIKPCTHAGVLFSKWGKQNFNLVGVYDSDEGKTIKFLDQWKVKERDLVLSSLTHSDILKRDIAFAIIATKSDSHFSIACQLIKSNIKYLLIEKPVSLNSRQAKKLKKLADRHRVKIWINHERRYHPRYKFVKNKIEDDYYGTVQSVRANVFTSAKNPGLAFSKVGGGPLLHDGTHAIDLLFWMFGKLKVRYANMVTKSKDLIEDRATAWLTSKKGIEIFLDVSGGRDYFQFEIDIFTSKYRIVLSNDGFLLFESTESKLYQGFRSLVPKKWKAMPKPEKSNAFLGIYKEISLNISKKSDYQEGTLEENIDILECIESIYQFRRKK